VAATVLATGDLMPQRPFTLDLALRDLFAAGCVFANLEVALTSRTEAADKLVCLRAEPALAGELARVGVDVVTLANNHVADYGTVGLVDTLAAVRGAGVRAVGAGRDLGAALEPALVEVGGLRIGFLGLACTLPNGCGAAVDRPGVAPLRVLARFLVDPVSIDEQPGMAPYVETSPMPGDLEVVTDAVRRAAARADALVIGIHWGIPHGFAAEVQGELATYQRPLAHALVEAGADAVVGHHPHVLHGVELHRGRPVFYSLGNFLFHSLLEREPVPRRPYPPYSWASLRGELNHLGGIARLRWEGPGPPAAVELIPVHLDAAGEPSPAKGEPARRALGRVVDLSRSFGTVLRDRGEVVEVLP
jgi:poly-gamma-glutamate capsule biosynthesis protein CapA/YwtB (metallophosphatase superfamily)